MHLLSSVSPFSYMQKRKKNGERLCCYENKTYLCTALRKKRTGT